MSVVIGDAVMEPEYQVDIGPAQMEQDYDVQIGPTEAEPTLRAQVSDQAKAAIERLRAAMVKKTQQTPQIQASAVTQGLIDAQQNEYNRQHQMSPDMIDQIRRGSQWQWAEDPQLQSESPAVTYPHQAVPHLQGGMPAMQIQAPSDEIEDDESDQAAYEAYKRRKQVSL